MTCRQFYQGEILLYGPAPEPDQLRLSLPGSWLTAETLLIAPPAYDPGTAAGLNRLAVRLQPWPVGWLEGTGAADPRALAAAAVDAAQRRRRVLALTAAPPWLDPVGGAIIRARGDPGGFNLQVLEVPGEAQKAPYHLAETPLDRLAAVMGRLLGPGGCPWDREQTHESLRPYVVEEAAEVIEAIEQGRPDKLLDELGDLLLQIVFHAELAGERGDFRLADVCAAIESKMIHRHPHVFDDWQVADAAEVLHNWDILKAEENAAAGERGESEPWRPLRKAAVRVALAALKVAFAGARMDERARTDAQAELHLETDRLVLLAGMRPAERGGGVVDGR